MNNQHSLLSVQRQGSVRLTLVTIALALVLISSLFAMPRPSIISSLPWKAEFFSSILLLGLGLCAAARARAGVTQSRLLILLLGFAGWSTLSALWAEFPLLTLHHTLLWGVYISFFVIFLWLVGRGTGIRIAAGAFALTALILGVLCLFDHLTVMDFASVEGPIRIRYGKLAELLVTITPFLWIMAVYARERQTRWMLAVAGAFGWMTVMLSLSKGAFLAGVIGSVVFFAGAAFFSLPSLRRRVLVMAGGWVAFTVLFQVGFSALAPTPSTADYFSGRSDATRSTSVMRLFTWRVSRQMITEHPVLGVGADNFGTAFNEARADLAARNTSDHTPEVAEDYVVERAHNEFLQVFGELGVVGFCLFLAIFGTFAFMAAAAFFRNGRRLPPALWACIAGMVAFFASSFVSSFSFRAAENGIAFFIVFAIGVNELIKLDRKVTGIRFHRGVTISLILFAAAAMIVYSSTKAAGQYSLYLAERSQDFETAASCGTTSLRLDPGNAGAYYYLATIYAKENDFGKASDLLSQSIYRGLGVSVTYSFLAKYQALAGDPERADGTLARAVKIFPNSTFLRVRYAVFLEDQGKTAEAADQMNAARSVDPRQAKGWYQIIRNGSVAAFYTAKADPTIAAPAELKPESAVFEYLDQKNVPADSGEEPTGRSLK
jgi:O-antigen ligase